MAVGFSDQFHHLLVPDSAAVKEAMTSGLVVLDSNVLLSAYRFAPGTRQELLATIERLGNRVWIPHQVGLEFHRNRYSVISEHAAAYKSVLDALADHQGKYEPELDQKIRQMCNRASLADPERDRLLALAASSLRPITEAIESLRDAHGLDSAFSEDSVLARIQAILNGKVGEPLTEEEEREAKEEATRRIREQIPPGYRDTKKECPEGDYFVWLQAMGEVKRRSLGWLVFVSGDVKEDWIYRVGGKTIGPRFELVQELAAYAGARLLMLEPRTFLHHAGVYLDLAVSAETLQQAGRITDARNTPDLDLEREVFYTARRIDDLHDAIALAARDLAESRAAVDAITEQRNAIEMYMNTTAAGKGEKALSKNSDDMAVARERLRAADAARESAYRHLTEGEMVMQMLQRNLALLRDQQRVVTANHDRSMSIG
jgi:hypothetical protein